MSNDAGGKRDTPDLAPIEKRLGYAFSNPDLARAALTHRSWANEQKGARQEDNERLEFLGDAAVDLAVSHRLMARFPRAEEGELSRLRAALVDEEGLARAARDVGLGALLLLGRGEELTGGREKPSVLADALEAVFGAVFLDSGLEAVMQVVDRVLGPAMEQVVAASGRDYKTRLQELVQARCRLSLKYRVVEERGPDHAKEFAVEVSLDGELLGRGEGRNKKEAEQAAAQVALGKMEAPSARPWRHEGQSDPE